jgi:hypothetical protein
MLISSRYAGVFDSGQLLRARSSQEADRSPVAATVNFRAGAQQFGRVRRASDRADPPRGSRRMQSEAQGRLAPPVQGHDTHTKRARNFALQFALRRQIIRLRQLRRYFRS